MREFIEKIVREAGEATLPFFGSASVQYKKKGIGGEVTEADLAANKIITDRIHEAYQGHHVLSEEGDTQLSNAEHLWIIDPLDGTRNFADRVPLFGVMAAYAKAGKVECAAIYLPCTKELFFAERGKGVFLNGEPIRCSSQPTIRGSYGCGETVIHEKKTQWYQKFLQRPSEDKFRLCILGSIAITAAYIASGRRDWEYSSCAKIWDLAAPSLLLQESGCRVTNLAGEEWTLKDSSMLAANPVLHSELLKVLQTN